MKYQRFTPLGCEDIEIKNERQRLNFLVQNTTYFDLMIRLQEYKPLQNICKNQISLIFFYFLQKNVG